MKPLTLFRVGFIGPDRLPRVAFVVGESLADIEPTMALAACERIEQVTVFNRPDEAVLLADAK